MGKARRRVTWKLQRREMRRSQKMLTSSRRRPPTWRSLTNSTCPSTSSSRSHARARTKARGRDRDRAKVRKLRVARQVGGRRATQTVGVRKGKSRPRGRILEMVGREKEAMKRQEATTTT